MLFAEKHALLFLIVHAILGGALVAASSHLVVWMRAYPRKRFGRHRAVRKLALLSAALYVATFLVGNVIYPTYKIRVRGEYLEDGATVLRDHQNRIEAHHKLRRKQRGELDQPVAEHTQAHGLGDHDVIHLPRKTAKLARWFDVKEHWAALGLALSIVCACLLVGWDPRKTGGAISTGVFVLAVGAAATAWLGVIIGLVVAAHRSVVGLN